MPVTFVKKIISTRVFSSEYCENFKKAFLKNIWERLLRKMCRKYFIKYLTEDFVTFRCIIATNSFLGLDTEHAFTVF